VTEIKDKLMDFSIEAGEAAAVLRALSNEARLLVLCHLSEAAELSAGELTRRVGLSQSALSQHLARLREEGLVTTRKEAQTVFYRVCDPRVARLLTLLHELFCPELGKGN
jgi:ArsR family transcriptional regulator, virulence genes transcriptional regulator